MWHYFISHCKKKSYTTLTSNEISTALLQLPKKVGRCIASPAQDEDNLNPWFITGFSDGESSFTVRIVKNNTIKVGWVVQPVFQIGLHKKDYSLLKKIEKYFGVGVIYNKEDSSNYVVHSLKGINVIVNHFEKYPFLTKKWEDFKLFSDVVSMISKKEHLTISGLHKIISLKASINNGLSLNLKNAFPDIIPAIKPKRSNSDTAYYVGERKSNIDPFWIAGFTAGEGCFSVRITKSLTMKTGFQVQLRFNITQYSIDKELMNSLVYFWGCGKVFVSLKGNRLDFQIVKFKDLCDKVIPLFQSISLQGVKSKDFADFCKVIEIIKVKGHLTNQGLNQIRKLKAGMNRGR